MKALVTGATGFVGSHLAEALRRRGDEVTALVRSPSKASALGSLGVRLVPGDLDDPGSLERAAEGQDVVFHVAGLLAARDEETFLRVTRDGTASLAAAAARARVGRFVYVSSMAAGGPAGKGRPLTGPSRRAGGGVRTQQLAGEKAWRRTLPCDHATAHVYGPAIVVLGVPDGAMGLRPVFGRHRSFMVHGADPALVAAGTATGTTGKIYYPAAGRHQRRVRPRGGRHDGAPVHLVPSRTRWAGDAGLTGRRRLAGNDDSRRTRPTSFPARLDR
jgi:hypothetical protein